MRTLRTLRAAAGIGHRLRLFGGGEIAAPKLAVLIDGDNMPAKIAENLFADIARRGEATIRRVYGNLQGSRQHGWAGSIRKRGLVAMHQYSVTPGKNAADIALTVDAMDILYSGMVDGFCLVSSDSDLTPLALKIRERGLTVCGYGTAQTPTSLRKACTTFILTENLRPYGETDPDAFKRNSRKIGEAKHLVAWALYTIGAGERPVELGHLWKHLHRMEPDFDPRTYGCSSFTDLLEKLEICELHIQLDRKHVRLTLAHIASGASQ